MKNDKTPCLLNSLDKVYFFGDIIFLIAKHFVLLQVETEKRQKQIKTKSKLRQTVYLDV